MKVMTDFAVQRMADAIVMLMDELSIARMMRPELGQPLITKCTISIYTMAVMSKSLGIRDQMMAHIMSYSPILHKILEETFKVYDKANEDELKSEESGEPTDVSHAAELIQSILKK